MHLDTLKWTGSSDRIDIETVEEPPGMSPDARRAQRETVANYLASVLPEFWPQQMVSGAMQSVDQRGSWVAEIARVYIADGLVVVARHTSSANGIIAAALTMPVPGERVSRLVVLAAKGYADEEVGPRLRDAVIAECARLGKRLARKVERVEWVPL